jgi:YidC/Oxa1 family membrane protein insertase
VEPIAFVWRNLLETPLVNYLVVLTVIFGGSYGLAIIALSVTTRALAFPLTMRTLRYTHRMKEIQPQLKELQQRYSNPAKRANAQRELLASASVSPLGCLGPQLIQFPIFIAVNRVVRITTASSAASVLPARLYALPLFKHAIPLQTHFLNIDLRSNGTLWMALAILVLMLLQQRISNSTATSTGRGSATAMAIGMSLLFASYVLRAPAGLALYWGTSTLMGAGTQLLLLRRQGTALRQLLPAPLRRAASISEVTLEANPEAVASSEPSPASEPSEGGSRRGRRNRRRRRRRSR